MYNAIMIPLRLVAMAIAALICIIAMCSFNHPFDMHYGIDEAIHEAQMRIDIDNFIEFHRKEMIDYNNRTRTPESRESLRAWREESDRELFGTFERNDPGSDRWGFYND